MKDNEATMLKVGLTGGIACGKTVVRRMLEARGAFTVDADGIVHELFRVDSKLAREVASLDRLSHWRVILRVGIGSPPESEFTRLGEEADARVRARKLDEGLEVLTGLWTGRPCSLLWEHYRLDDATL